jgi:hypothetical protein
MTERKPRIMTICKVKNENYEQEILYLYLIGDIIALILLIKDIVTTYPAMISAKDIAFDIIPAGLLFYLAFKTYQEKNDQELR